MTGCTDLLNSNHSTIGASLYAEDQQGKYYPAYNWYQAPLFFFFLLSCLTGSTWSFSELKDGKKSDLLAASASFAMKDNTISLSFPQGKADPKSSMGGNKWVWLPSRSCVVCLCLPREALAGQHCADTSLLLTSTKGDALLAWRQEGGRGNLMACEVLLSSRSFLAAVMFPCFPPAKLT